MALRAGDFRNRIGSNFILTIENETREAVLIEVKKYESLSETSQSDNKEFNESDDPNCFSLTFRLAEKAAGNQATYAVQHDNLGEFQLFLVPGNSNEREPQLVGVINRSR